MGIQGLLPFLGNSTRDAQISEFENEFVAIDAYCWLHKGIYSCSVEIAMKKPTKKYVTYCMRYIDMLLYFKVKPILVFDGKKLSSKEETERKRREDRKIKYKKGIEFIKAGKMNEGRKLLGESVDVTHELAVNLMKECRKKNIDCIVAPYEADAQLAYLSLNNYVKCVVTEDSDLLAYGCERVMFKMDTSGRGKLIEKNQIYLSLDMSSNELTEDKFRYMCILSGCDYLPSLPSIGPANALKFVKLLKDKDIYEVLPKLPIYLNKLKANVSTEYIQGFKVAVNTFKHQIIYNPHKRKEMPLLPVNNDEDCVGEKLPDDLAFQLALGNIDPITMKRMDNFDPDEAGMGFNILWTQDFLPNATSLRSNNFNYHLKLNDSKKRQRECIEFDIASNNSDLKKQCFPQNIPHSKNLSSKKTVNVPKIGFIFEPKVLDSKKNNLSKIDQSTLLKSRYFASNNINRSEKRELSAASGRRKDESNEEYLQRLYNEYFPDTEDAKDNLGKESFKKKENGSTELEMNKSSSSCEGDLNLFECKILENTISKTDSILKEDENEKINTHEISHSLLDEIYKSELKISVKEKTDIHTQSEETDKKLVEEESFFQKLSHDLSNFFLSKNSMILEDGDKSESVDVSGEKENQSKTVIDIDSDEKFGAEERTPSPVFKVQKGFKVLSSNSLGNISDTAGTPTSVYFSAKGSRSFQRSNSVISVKQTPTTSNKKMPSLRSFGGSSSKAGKPVSSVNRTLFQFGFKKSSKAG